MTLGTKGDGGVLKLSDNFGLRKDKIWEDVTDEVKWSGTNSCLFFFSTVKCKWNHQMANEVKKKKKLWFCIKLRGNLEKQENQNSNDNSKQIH